MNESHVLQLFQTRPDYRSLVTETKITTKGIQIKISWSCGRHSGEWKSCPDCRGLVKNSLLISASTVLTGATYTDIANWAKLLNISIPSDTTYYNMPRTYIQPTIQFVYQKEHDQIIFRLVQNSKSGKGLELCGDGRCDSPGKHLLLCVYMYFTLSYYIIVTHTWILI